MHHCPTFLCWLAQNTPMEYVFGFTIIVTIATAAIFVYRDSGS